MSKTVEFKFDIGDEVYTKHSPEGSAVIGTVCGLYYDEFGHRACILYYSSNKNNHITLYEDDLCLKH